MRAAEDNREQSDAPVPTATKGLRIATRCATVEQFVQTYHQICEDSAIFIPNTQRPVKTVMQFRFDLQDGNPALLGIGTVVEELTTKQNRFDHVGIVVELQGLSRTSSVTFDQMLAARAKSKLRAPAPVYPRARTVPVDAVEQIPLPSATAPRSPTTRTKTVVGLPTLAKKATVRIPAIIAPPTQKLSVAIPTKQPTPVTVQPAPQPKPPAAVPSSIDDGWDSVATKMDDAQPEPAPPVVATTPAAVVKNSFDVSDETAVDPVVAREAEAEPELFDTITAVESPDGFLLEMMRRPDGRAAPAMIIEAAVDPSPVTFAISEPIVEAPSIVEDMPAVMEHTFAPPPLPPPPLVPATFRAFVPIAMPAIDHAALAAVPVKAARRPRRWLAAAGAFAVLLCVIAATTMFIDRPAASVPPTTTFAPAHESQLDSSAAVATARDQAPPVAVAPKKAPVRAIAPPVVVKSKTPPPAPRPFRRPVAKKKCKDLGCL